MGKGRPKLSVDDVTVRMVVRVPASKQVAVEADAARLGLTVPEWLRLAIDVGLERRPSRVSAANAAGLKSVGAILNGSASHDHVAGKPLSGGISPCTVGGCQARKVMGRWVVA